MVNKPAPDLEIEAVDVTAAAAQELIVALSAELAGRYDHADDGSGGFATDSADSGSVFLVGSVAGTPVACGALRPLDSDTAELKRMFVSPAARGRGHARAMLVALESRAHALGYVAIRLETGIRQPEAIGLYESAGYRRIPCYGEYVHSERSVCFEKRLTS